MRLSKSIILQLKQSKITLEKSFNQMSLVLNTMSELVAYQDLEHKLMYVNRASAESVGKTPEELVGKYCYEIWGDGKTVCQDCPVERALRNAEPQTGYIQSPDRRSWMIKGYPVKNEKGEIIGAMEVTMDITEIENLKKKMSETDRNYKFIVDNISDVVFQQDKNLKITYVSPSVEKLTGYSVEEIMNMNLLDLMTPESYKRGVENFNKYYEASVRDMVSEILLSSGYIVLRAKNGEEAKEMLNNSKIDFIVSDVIMPRMDGKELCKHVRENFPDIKFLFMSGYMDNDVLLKDVKDEKVNFVKKPFAPQDLLIKVNNILDSSALNQF